METEGDEVLRKIKTYVRCGLLNSVKSVEPEIRPFWGVHNDISIIDDLLLAWSRIVP